MKRTKNRNVRNQELILNLFLRLYPREILLLFYLNSIFSKGDIFVELCLWAVTLQGYPVTQYNKYGIYTYLHCLFSIIKYPMQP